MDAPSSPAGANSAPAVDAVGRALEALIAKITDPTHDFNKMGGKDVKQTPSAVPFRRPLPPSDFPLPPSPSAVPFRRPLPPSDFPLPPSPSAVPFRRPLLALDPMATPDPKSELLAARQRVAY